MTNCRYFINAFGLFLFLIVCIASSEIEYCEKPDEYTEEGPECSKHSEPSKKRYILYDVNRPEGFNLRRDVYIRAAVFVKNLAAKRKDFEWQLVLPPWGGLYHWQSGDLGIQNRIPWSLFFDVPSLRKFAPVIEMHEFLREYTSENGETTIDRVYVLQNDEEMFETGNFVDKNQLVDCQKNRRGYKLLSPDKYGGEFWGYSNLTAREVKCLVFHGTTTGLEQNLYPNLYSSIMFDHMEIALHDSYGSKEYWAARRSMRYNSDLYKIASDYRKNYLESNDVNDKTQQPFDWTKEKAGRNAAGGPYLCVHLRRRDFLRGRAASVPTIESAANQLRKKMKKLNLNIIFVATDAEDREYSELKANLAEYTVMRFSPSNDVRRTYKDGGVSVIDQIICSHARYFIGTHESTFSFRIQEDREIMGFPSNTTFNRLCGKEKKCSKGGRWEIVW